MAKLRRGGLGRGMDALFKETKSELAGNPSEGGNGPVKLPIAKVHPNPNQPRTHFDEEKLNELSLSIERNGIIQPLLVRPDGEGYMIIAGERRYQAARRAGLEEVPAVVREVDDTKMLELALIENLQRSDLNPIEEARGYRELLQQSELTQTALAEAVSKSRSAITNSLRLLDLPEEIQQYLFDGKLTAGHARAILAVPSDEQKLKLAEKVVAEGLSVRATENLAPLFSVGETPKAPRPVMPSSYKKAARELRSVLDANVKVKNLRGKNKIEIEFKDEDDLSRILGIIGME